MPRLALLMAGLLGLLLPVSTALPQEVNYISTPGAAERAVGLILEKIGRTPQVFRIQIEPTEVKLRVQGEGRAHHIDEWNLSRMRIWKFERERVSGPDPVQPDGIVGAVETGVFPISDIPLTSVADVARAALDYAGLEDSGDAASVVIERRLSILPQPSYGDVRWTISVRSPRESATVTADAEGRIFGGDLSQTQRAQRLDLLRDDWPLPQAQAQLAAVLGPREVVHEVYFYNSYISVDADHPTDPKLESGYSWDLGGVKRAIGDAPNILRTHGLGDQVPFAFSELDFSILPKLKQEARARLQMPDAQLSILEAEKPVAGIGEPRLEWRLEFKDAKGEVGTVTADMKGAILKVFLPESRRPKEPWLSPRMVRANLDRIAKEIGPEAQYLEISFGDEDGRIIVEDPREPGATAQFFIDSEDIRRFGTPFEQLSPDRVFSIADAASIDPARIEQLFARTLQLLAIPNGKVTRITFSRGFMISSPRRLLVVEVRAANPKDTIGGRVNFEADGTELEVVGP